MDDSQPGLYEALVTGQLTRQLTGLDKRYAGVTARLRDAEAADRISRHLAGLISAVVEAFPERGRAEAGVELAAAVIGRLEELAGPSISALGAAPVSPSEVLEEIVRKKPDGSSVRLARPLTPLLDTTILTNARGEPAVAHELVAEIPSADRVDALVAFIRWSGIRGMLPALRAACDEGRAVRVLTTTYTNSTELRALEALVEAGAEVKVSYDTSLTRLHAKAWLFQRHSGYSTAYIGSSNLTHSAQQTGVEWNVRISGARNPDILAKMTALFESYWQGNDFVLFDREEFTRRTENASSGFELLLSPIEIELRPFQEQLLEKLDLARYEGRHRNLLVAATGTGKTVMAAVDYARLRDSLGRDRLLFVAHRDEILEQSRAMFAHALRDAAFGERWVGGERPSRYEHVFASIQSLNTGGIRNIDPDHFDVVIVDEFHHAAAPSYKTLLEHLQPKELLGLTATPERTDGLDVLRYFGGRISAELRLWDAIDQQFLCPFDYFGIYDGADLTKVPWRRGRGYDVEALSNVLTSDHLWANRVIDQVAQKVADPRAMRALGFCVGVDHARFMAERFTAAGIPSIVLSGGTPMDQRRSALNMLRGGEVSVLFTVDLFNEGVDVPTVDTLLMLRPTDSATLFLQQLGRGLRKSSDKPVCTVLDFVSNHRKEFRYDQRFRALLGGSRKAVERQVEQEFPFLPAGCQISLDSVAREAVLRSIRNAVPSRWRDKCAELRAIGNVSLAEYLDESGLDVEDIYDGNHSWIELRREAGLRSDEASPIETQMVRAVGRLTHIDDEERLDRYRKLLTSGLPDTIDSSVRDRRLLRMLVGSLTTLPTSASFNDALSQLRSSEGVQFEISELLTVLSQQRTHVTNRMTEFPDVPLHLHARYTRAEILAAFEYGGSESAKPMAWQTGVLWHEGASTDMFAFTLDKSGGGFSPTTRYRDYAITRDLIHWESQSVTTVAGGTGQRYIHHAERGSRIMLFARLSQADRALWCLGPATYVSHQGERPIAFTWRLEHSLPADLYADFAAAVV